MKSFFNLFLRISLAALSLIALTAKDLDRDGIDDAFEDQLLQRFAPRIHLARGDVDLPADYLWAITNSVLTVNGEVVMDNSAIQENPAGILNYSDFHRVRRYMPEVKLDLLDSKRRGASREEVLASKNVGMFGHVAPVRYEALGLIQNFIVIQYYQYFPNNRIHVDVSFPCPDWDLTGISCEIRDAIEEAKESQAHEGDLCLFEVFIRETDLVPVVHVWYHHAFEQYSFVPGYLPPNNIRSSSDSKDSIISFLDAYHDIRNAVPSLPQIADIYVGLQGHEFWRSPGEDAFRDLRQKISDGLTGIPVIGEIAGDLVELLDPAINEFLRPTTYDLEFQSQNIPNIGEIDHPRSDFELYCRFAGDYGPRKAPQGPMHNTGLKWQWPGRTFNIEWPGFWSLFPGADAYPTFSYPKPYLMPSFLNVGNMLTLLSAPSVHLDPIIIDFDVPENATAIFPLPIGSRLTKAGTFTASAGSARLIGQ